MRKEFSGALRQLDLHPGDTLMVHSAFAGLSRHGLRAEDAIDELLSRLGTDGTLLMPAMSWRNVLPTNPLWHEILTESHVGILAELFRTRYARRRSLHPTHSVSGTGRLTDHFLGSHSNAGVLTPCPPESPFGRLAQANAKILMIGTGLETCTAMHCPEETIDAPCFLRPDVETYYCWDRDGEVHTIGIRRHQRIQRDFPAFEPVFVSEGVIRVVYLREVPFRLIDAAGMQAVMAQAVARDRYATLRKDVRPCA
jgi:aminoglycoside 3-N-acetyltransferase